MTDPIDDVFDQLAKLRPDAVVAVVEARASMRTDEVEDRVRRRIRETAGLEIDRIVVTPPGTIPQIMHLFAWRPEATQHLGRFTQAVMREARELSAGQCELIAAVVSGKNRCLF